MSMFLGEQIEGIVEKMERDHHYLLENLPVIHDSMRIYNLFSNDADKIQK